jgi:ABC-type transporter Mla maintaining outer membrane lipid asymmetry ATPase subunit MlaF
LSAQLAAKAEERAAEAAVAVRYERKRPEDDITVIVPAGQVMHLHVPDHDAKSHLVTAILKARCVPGETLELFGMSVADLPPRERARLRARTGAVSKVVGLVTNLNAWENISLPAAYHGHAPLEDVARVAHAVLAAFGIEPERFLARLPDELGMLERKVAAFIRALITAPELMLLDALEDGLSPQECRQVTQFESVYRARQPAGTVLYAEVKED